MKPVQALLLDIDGVLTVGGRPIPGAIDALEILREHYPIRFITNTTTKTRHEMGEKLRSAGFAVDDGEIFSALDALVRYVEGQGGRAFCLVHERVRGALTCLDGEPVTHVVMGDAREGFGYHALNEAFNHLMGGAELVAAAVNRYFRESEEKLALDMGGYVKLLEYASGKEAVIVGKPEKAFFLQAAAALGVAPEKVLMVGDDVESDVAGAVNAGLEGVLVQTGKFRPEHLEKLPAGAETIGSFADLPNFLGV